MAKGTAGKNYWALLLMILAGVVLGGFIGQLSAGVPALRWLNYGQTFGLSNPLVLDLGILVLTFGLTIKNNDRRHHRNCAGDPDLPIPVTGAYFRKPLETAHMLLHRLPSHAVGGKESLPVSFSLLTSIFFGGRMTKQFPTFFFSPDIFQFFVVMLMPVFHGINHRRIPAKRYFRQRHQLILFFHIIPRLRQNHYRFNQTQVPAFSVTGK